MSATTVYAAHRIKHRRSTAELDTLYDAMIRIVAADTPMTLRGLVRDCIERHIDPTIMQRTRTLEAKELDTLNSLVTEVWA